MSQYEQEPGVAEAEFSRIDTKLLIKKFLVYRKPKALIVPKEKGFGGSPHTSIDLPSWLSEEDVAYYATNFDRTGFTGGLNYYRCMNLYASYILYKPYAPSLQSFNGVHAGYVPVRSFQLDIFIGTVPCLNSTIPAGYSIYQVGAVCKR